jgi:hypothetical protein
VGVCHKQARLGLPWRSMKATFSGGFVRIAGESVKDKVRPILGGGVRMSMKKWGSAYM